VNGIIELLVICCVFVHERKVVSTSFLAQASMSCLGEINRGSSKLLHASSRSGDPRSFWASERLAQARGVSPKRDHTWGYCSPFSSPRLGEGGSPEQDSSAWARSWAMAVWCLVVSLFLDDWHLLGCNCYVKNKRWMVMYE